MTKKVFKIKIKLSIRASKKVQQRQGGVDANIFSCLLGLHAGLPAILYRSLLLYRTST